MAGGHWNTLLSSQSLWVTSKVYGAAGRRLPHWNTLLSQQKSMGRQQSLWWEQPAVVQSPLKSIAGQQKSMGRQQSLWAAAGVLVAGGCGHRKALWPSKSLWDGSKVY